MTNSPWNPYGVRQSEFDLARRDPREVFGETFEDDPIDPNQCDEAFPPMTPEELETYEREYVALLDAQAASQPECPECGWPRKKCRCRD